MHLPSRVPRYGRACAIVWVRESQQHRSCQGVEAVRARAPHSAPRKLRAHRATRLASCWAGPQRSSETIGSRCYELRAASAVQHTTLRCYPPMNYVLLQDGRATALVAGASTRRLACRQSSLRCVPQVKRGRALNRHGRSVFFFVLWLGSGPTSSTAIPYPKKRNKKRGQPATSDANCLEAPAHMFCSERRCDAWRLLNKACAAPLQTFAMIARGRLAGRVRATCVHATVAVNRSVACCGMPCAFRWKQSRVRPARAQNATGGNSSYWPRACFFSARPAFRMSRRRSASAASVCFATAVGHFCSERLQLQPNRRVPGGIRSARRRQALRVAGCTGTRTSCLADVKKACIKKKTSGATEPPLSRTLARQQLGPPSLPLP